MNNSSITQLIQEAVQFHQTGQLQEATERYQLVLQIEPDNVDANHLLGVIAAQLGNNSTAFELLSKTIQINPRFAEAHNNLGNILRSMGQLEAAIASFNNAILINQNYAEAYNNTGCILRDTNQLEKAVFYFKRATEINATYTDAHNNLGHAQLEAGNLNDAINCFKRAIASASTYAVSYNNLGNALKEAGRFDDAIKVYMDADRIEPGNAETYNNLASILCTVGRVDEAIINYRKVISLKPDFVPVYNELGNALKISGQIEEAITSYQKAIELKPDYALAYNNLAVSHILKSHHNRAIDYFRKALAIEPDNVEVLNNLGNVLKETGQVDEGIACYRKALSINPDFSETWLMLSGAKKYTEYNNDMRTMEELYFKNDLPEKEKVYLAFALGKAYEDLKEYEVAFDYILEANRLKRKTYQYSIADEFITFTKIKKLFSSEFFDRHQNAGRVDSTPIFILGMPRSGTSLVEQILASHPQVFGAGELHYLVNLFNQQGNSKSSESEIHPPEFNKLGDEYIKRIRSLAITEKYVTDKMPGNFIFIGFIRAILPNAKIIHCVRDPMDNCWSIFKNHFSSMKSYAYNIEEIGQYYNLYRDLMSHWHTVVPDYVYDIKYEDLVADPELQIKKLIGHCGLHWDEACLSFYDSNRRVATASATQIRQPIYKDSVGLWGFYKTQLAELNSILSDASCVST
ncbi:MAG: tetratricopeptide repeat protein [Gammaproteobacteria bacterium]|nr:tetratricopeptide repeat protein [Gammaproteobacteria bacterium]